MDSLFILYEYYYLFAYSVNLDNITQQTIDSLQLIQI